MQIVRIGPDLAEYVFEVHAVDAQEKVVLRERLRREGMAAFFAELPPCLVGMEACSSAHYWAEVLSDLGHEVRLMAPQFVTPYVKSNKSDHNDAEARLARRSAARRCGSCRRNPRSNWPCRRSAGSASGWCPTGRGR